MSATTTTEGTVITVRQDFLDDYDEALVPKSGYPLVKLVDSDGSNILQATATASIDIAGTWYSDISIPILGLTDSTPLTIQWTFLTQDNQRYTVKDTLIVEPAVQARDTDIVASLGSTTVSFSLPLSLLPSDRLFLQVYQNNTPLLDEAIDIAQEAGFSISGNGLSTTVITMPQILTTPSLYACLLQVELRRVGAPPQTYPYRYYYITPQLQLQADALDKFLNKARIENTIAELRWSNGDLVYYLEQGLQYFNTVGQSTGFNGLNMQGVLFNAHVLCSLWSAINAQLLAEQALKFEYSGQGVSLNVDRTPALESALGRVETQIEQVVKPLKIQLANNGHLNGDGSIGSQKLNNPLSKGTLGLSNAATTHIQFPTSINLTRRY